MHLVADTMFLGRMPDWALLSLPHAVGMMFAFAFGSCVGSFINVLVYRLPLQMSVLHPPSRCPICGHRLSWRENLPMVGWLLLGGRCKACLVKIPIRYPVVEVFTGTLMALLYMALFCIPGDDTFGRIGGGFWYSQGFLHGSASFMAIAILMAMLVAATIIDAETYTIPLSLTTVSTAVALAGWGLQGFWRGPASAGPWPIGLVGWQGVGMAVGGAVGVILSNVLLWRGILKPSFADYGEYVKEGEPLADYPHARREMLHELRFLAAPVTLLVIGGWLGATLKGNAPSVVISSFSSAVLGYLVGAALVWGVRIGGTLGFGREAMGLGDVHLMGAVGAALGAAWVAVAFFLAPFIALTWVAWTGLARRKGGTVRELPYGPHLAIASVLCVFARPAILDAGKALFPALVEPPTSTPDLVLIIHKIWWGLAFAGTGC